MEVKDLITEYNSPFALDDLVLGQTILVKHTIDLINPTPFKVRYQRIPPHQFNDVKKHLQETLKVGDIRRSNSP